MHTAPHLQANALLLSALLHVIRHGPRRAARCRLILSFIEATLTVTGITLRIRTLAFGSRSIQSLGAKALALFAETLGQTPSDLLRAQPLVTRTPADLLLLRARVRRRLCSCVSPLYRAVALALLVLPGSD